MLDTFLCVALDITRLETPGSMNYAAKISFLTSYRKGHFTIIIKANLHLQSHIGEKTIHNI